MIIIANAFKMYGHYHMISRERKMKNICNVLAYSKGDFCLIG